ncbi:MAG: hypothetical protein VB055_01190 [Oscillospiraceae bacterium]|nr:hypothetical protein [Oscillospiraceae bacterium]
MPLRAVAIISEILLTAVCAGMIADLMQITGLDNCCADWNQIAQRVSGLFFMFHGFFFTFCGMN